MSIGNCEIAFSYCHDFGISTENSIEIGNHEIMNSKRVNFY